VSNNFVHEGRRLTVIFTKAHKAGDLVYEKGFYGKVEDDVNPLDTGTLILEGAHTFWTPQSTIAMGTVVAAPVTVGGATIPSAATSLQIRAYQGPTGIGGTGVTAGWNPIGRTIATGNATQVSVQLFNPNSAY
jgi:predicted RecA/RadA family phage recombinase